MASNAKRRSPLQRAYSNLRKVKGKHCKGKANKTQLSAAKKAYIEKAVKKGKSQKEATAIANRVVNGKCAR